MRAENRAHFSSSRSRREDYGLPAAATAAFIAVAPAIALADLAALFLVDTGLAQPLAKAGMAAFIAVAPAIALADLAALIFEDAGLAQTLAIAGVILHLGKPG